MASSSNRRSEIEEQGSDDRNHEPGRSHPYRGRLLKSLLNKRWDSVIEILQVYPELKTQQIHAGYTPLSYAMTHYKSVVPYIWRLIHLMTEELECEDDDGNTPLHTLANFWPPVVEAASVARFLIQKNETLPYKFNKDGLLPIHMAFGEATPLQNYLSQVTDLQKLPTCLKSVAKESENRIETFYWRKKRLEKALLDGKWESVIDTLENHPKLKTKRVTVDNETPLAVALRNYKTLPEYIDKLLELMIKKDLEWEDEAGNTTLHILARLWPPDVSDATRVAELLIKKNEDLPYKFNKDGFLPVHLAKEKREDSPLYLYLSEQTHIAKLSDDELWKKFDADMLIQPPWRQELEKLVTQGNWESAKGILNEHPEGKTERIIRLEETLLAYSLRNHETWSPHIESLVKYMQKEDLDSRDDDGNTALHIVAWQWPPLDAERVARLLVERNDALLHTFNNEELLPVHIARIRKGSPLYSYLSQQTNTERLSNEEQQLAKKGFETVAFIHGMFPLGPPSFFTPRRFINSYEVLKKTEDVASKLQKLAVNVPSFSRVRKSVRWKSLINPLTQQKNASETKSAAKKLLKRCKYYLTEIGKEEFEEILKAPFFTAAANGKHELVRGIIDIYPPSLEFEDEHNRTFFEIAILHRREKIIDIIVDLDHLAKKTKILSRIDADGNNMIHLMARKPFLDDLASQKAVFHMQREIQLFEKLASMEPNLMLQLNKDKKSPSTLFEEEHGEMAQNELAWIFAMATSCSLAASIIATVTFTSVITVPGGNNNLGFANFTGRRAFTTFIIFDALALVSSLTSLISFISIFTSRYGVHGFLKAIPNRIILGLISMIFSIIFLVIGFGITILLEATSHMPLVLLATVLLGAIPILTLVSLQLPSLSKMITCTDGYRKFKQFALSFCGGMK